MTKKTYFKLYFGIFACLMLTFSVMPLMGDDMTFYAKTNGMGIGDIFSYAFSYGNGRLLGNAAILLILKNTLVRAGAKALVLTGITYFTAKLCEIETLPGKILTAVIIIFSGNTYIAQIYTWSAGFTNYAVPVFMLLFILYIIKSCNRRTGLSAAVLCAVVFVLGTASQLFSENTTVFNVILAAFTVYVSAKTSGKTVRPLPLTYLLSTVCGAILMYYIPYMSHTVDKIEWYRDTSLKSIKSIFSMAAGNFTQILYGVSQLAILWAVLSICLILQIKRSERQPVKKRTRNFVFGVLCAFPLFIFASFVMYDYLEFVTYSYSFGITALTAVYILVVFIVLCRWLPAELRRTCISLFLLTVVSLVPLLAVKPIGIRTFYISFIVMVCLSLYLVKNTAPLIPSDGYETLIKKTSCVALSVLMFVSFYIYAETGYSHYLRDRYIRAQIEAGETIVHIPPILHKTMVFNADKIYQDEGLPAIYYRDEPGDVDFIVEHSFRGWYEQYYEEEEAQTDEQNTDVVQDDTLN